MPDSITGFPRRVARRLTRRLQKARGIDDRGIDDRGIDERGIDERGIDERGIDERGIDERGIDDRGIDDIDTLHEFWRQPEPEQNVPRTYVSWTGRSEALLKLISDLPPETRILEVGCNVGRNLAYLVDHGYPNVEGIEISPHAVELLRQTYPQLVDSNIHLGSAEEVLPGLADDSFDLVFTMAVIEHIHPSSTAVFDHMVRVGKSILSIEPPGRTSHRQYPHDVPEIFQSRGLRLVSSTPMSTFPETANDGGLSIFSAYRFERTG
jgi:SAM-dependent methyltransferase